MIGLPGSASTSSRARTPLCSKRERLKRPRIGAPTASPRTIRRRIGLRPRDASSPSQAATRAPAERTTDRPQGMAHGAIALDSAGYRNRREAIVRVPCRPLIASDHRRPAASCIRLKASTAPHAATPEAGACRKGWRCHGPRRRPVSTHCGRVFSASAPGSRPRPWPWDSSQRAATRRARAQRCVERPRLKPPGSRRAHPSSHTTKLRPACHTRPPSTRPTRPSTPPPPLPSAPRKRACRAATQAAHNPSACGSNYTLAPWCDMYQSYVYAEACSGRAGRRRG
jgi:hypothetical protein